MCNCNHTNHTHHIGKKSAHSKLQFAREFAKKYSLIHWEHRIRKKTFLLPDHHQWCAAFSQNFERKSGKIITNQEKRPDTKQVAEKPPSGVIISLKTEDFQWEQLYLPQVYRKKHSEKSGDLSCYLLKLKVITPENCLKVKKSVISQPPVVQETSVDFF